MIRFENPPRSENGVDSEEFIAIRDMLEKRLRQTPETLGWKTMASLQIEGYGEDIHPKNGFGDRFDATLEALKLHFVTQNLYIYGSYSDGDPYCQPYSCWDISLYDYQSTQDSYYHLLWDFPLADIMPAISPIKNNLESQLTPKQISDTKTKIGEGLKRLAELEARFTKEIDDH